MVSVFTKRKHVGRLAFRDPADAARLWEGLAKAGATPGAT